MNKKITKQSLASSIFLILIVIGVCFRLYNLSYGSPFDWDQEYSVSFPAKEILKEHKFPLIGAKTGVGNLFIGPLYSYLAAIFYYLFSFNPLAGVYLSVFLSFLFLGIGFILIKSLFGIRRALYFILFWSVNPLLIRFDRIAWNVNLLPFAAILVLAGIFWLILGKKKELVVYLLAGTGIFLGINSHFTVVFLIVLLLIIFLQYRKSINAYFLLVPLFVFLGILPLFVFDLRHDLMLSRNLWLFLNSQTQGIVFYKKILPALLSQVSVLGNFMLYTKDNLLQLLALFLIFFLAFSLFKKSYQKQLLSLFFTLFFIYLIGFSFYQGELTDYYYFGLFPFIVLIMAEVAASIEKQYPKIKFIIVLFSLFSLYRSFGIVNEVLPNGLGVKEKVVSKIKENSLGQPVKIIYDMDLGLNFGYQYLFDYYQIKLTDTPEMNNKYWLSFPTKRFPAKPDFTFGEISLGLPDTTQFILATKQVSLYEGLLTMRVPKDWSVIRCPDNELDKYLLTANHFTSCSTFSIEREGITVFNIPDCRIPEIKDQEYLLVDSSFGLSTNKEVQKNQRSPIYIQQLNNLRCLFIFDLKNPDFSSQPSETVNEIIKNIIIN